MSISWILINLAGLAISATRELTVDVRLSGADSSSKQFQEHKRVTAGLFQEIDVSIHWIEDAHDKASGPGRLTFDLRLIEHALPDATPDALASTLLADGSITIYSDRVAKRFEKVHPGIRKIALAYVLAHELAHAMQGIGRHSDTGIMKAHWPDKDLLAMMFRKLKFTDHDVLLIRRGIEQRLAKQIGARAKTERQ